MQPRTGLPANNNICIFAAKFTGKKQKNKEKKTNKQNTVINLKSQHSGKNKKNTNKIKTHTKNKKNVKDQFYEALRNGTWPPEGNVWKTLSWELPSLLYSRNFSVHFYSHCIIV